MNRRTNTKVAVAMSGGIDSSAAAALLKDGGYDVIGITMRHLPSDGAGPAAEVSGCHDYIEQAASAAQALGIPHYIVDLTGAFYRNVIADFCREYASGRTPNPCVLCNERIKFGSLLREAHDLGAEYIATGHYAKIQQDAITGRFLLKKGADRRKDQSYVLYRLTQEQLRCTMLPVGALTKEAVREIARALNPPAVDRAESQDVCFIPDRDYSRFLREHAVENICAGPILDAQGNVRGAHEGIQFYTIGQRKKLGITHPVPLYVTAILPEKNTIVVGEEADLYCSRFIVGQINWISVPGEHATFTAAVKIRYAHKETAAQIIPVAADRVEVRFSVPQQAVTPGQSAVFYREDTVIGGGIIAGTQTP